MGCEVNRARGSNVKECSHNENTDSDWKPNDDEGDIDDDDYSEEEVYIDDDENDN